MSYTPTAPRGNRGDYAGGRDGSGAGRGRGEGRGGRGPGSYRARGSLGEPFTPRSLSPLNSKEGRDKKAPYLSAPEELVTFIVGENKQRFTIHEEFVCYHSPVLSAAFNGCFMEGTTKTYTLDDIAPKNSDYSPNTSMPTKSRSRSMRQEPANWLEDYGVLNGAHLKYIYKNTQSGNQLRRLITFQCVRYAEDGFFVNNGADFPHELLVDTATLFQQGVSGPIRLEDYVITRD
ncbi:uncharacterized protein RSE6_02820 [Rhynchosporium secalis]|uniref:BTB domain-containing protein n=1 Tax=Rhynchosporium secalis TaxID=38038 RepID=A0A1E1M1B7_RHYSE|nr:uncharacterized protein RSE6_02820 [Rhynchosporium secalis]